MPGGELARQWFIPGQGIDRHVITADIQRYLGNDATVRPGRGTEPTNEVSPTGCCFDDVVYLRLPGRGRLLGQSIP